MKENLTLDSITQLGGDEDDLKLLNSKSTKFNNKKIELKDEEFTEFYKNLGFKSPKKESPNVNSISKTAKKSKFKSDESAQVVESKINTEKVKTKKKKSKKKKNKEDAKVQIKIEAKDPFKNVPHDDPVKIPTITVAANHFEKVFEMIADTPKKTLIQDNKGVWYNSPIISMDERCNEKYEDETIKKLFSIANQLLDKEIELYKEAKDKNNSTWMKTVVSSGTISDKIAAYTLLLDASTIHNIPCLQSLLNLVSKKGTREVLLGMEKFQELMIANVLPENRKLKYFRQQPLSLLTKLSQNNKKNDVLLKLLYWASEHRFKDMFSQYISRLAEILQGNIDTMKVKAMGNVLSLISSRPEQEDVLLKMLVNKFGDPKFKLASKALHMLHSLVHMHPAMHGVIAREVRDLLLRPNVNEKCQYYCICFLSSLILSHEQSAVADFLIEIYLAFYKAFSTRKRVNDKVLSALLTGVNRAYPYTTTSNDKITSEMDSLYKSVHTSSVSTAVQSLMLLFQILSSRDLLNDRYYNALYSVLLNPQLSLEHTRHPMFLNLLYKSIKSDEVDSRSCSFLKRILQSCTLHGVPYSSACLVLLSEIFENKKSLSLMINGSFSKTMDLSDDEDEFFVDVDDDNESKGKNKQTDIKSSWTHKQSANESNTVQYDPLHRSPLYANANKTMLWELHTLHRHFHPTVSLFTENVAKTAEGNYEKNQSDPLQDFTVMKFLDKFVYRNPKQLNKAEKNSNQTTFSRKRHQSFVPKDVAANSKEFLQKKHLKPEEIFLHKYFFNKEATNTSEEIKEDEEISDVESVSDDEFDKYLNTKEGKLNLMESMGSDFDEENSGEEDMADLELEGNELMEDISEDEDPMAEDAGIFLDADEEVQKPKKKDTKTTGKIKKQKKNTNAAAAADDFGSMLEETASSQSNIGGSNAVFYSEKMSAKQLNWERKQEEREIIAKKRAFKRKPKHFGKKPNMKRKRF